MFYYIVRHQCILVENPSYVAQINQFKLKSNANTTCQRLIEQGF
jgi:hypothetical protein